MTDLAEERDTAIELAAQLRAEMKRIADQLDHLPADRGDMARLAAHIRTIATAGPDNEPACWVCGCTPDDPCAGGCQLAPASSGRGEQCTRCEGAVRRITIDYLDTGDTEVTPLAAGQYLLVTAPPAWATSTIGQFGDRIITVHGGNQAKR